MVSLHFSATLFVCVCDRQDIFLFVKFTKQDVTYENCYFIRGAFSNQKCSNKVDGKIFTSGEASAKQ